MRLILFCQCDAPPLNGFWNCVYTALNHLSECLTQLWKTSISTYKYIYFKCFLRIRRCQETWAKSTYACFIFGSSRQVTTLSVGLQWLSHKLWLHWLHKSICKYPTLWWSHSVDGGVSPLPDVSCDVKHTYHLTLCSLSTMSDGTFRFHIVFWFFFKLSVLIIYLNLYLNLYCWLYVPNVCEGFCQNCLKMFLIKCKWIKWNPAITVSVESNFSSWTFLVSIGASIVTIHNNIALLLNLILALMWITLNQHNLKIHLTIISGSHRIITFIISFSVVPFMPQ